MKWPAIFFPILLLAFSFPPLLFASQNNFYTEIEAGTAYEELNRNYSSWRSTYLEIKSGDSPRRFILLNGRQTRRFSLTDKELAGIISLPLGAKYTAAIEGSASSTHEVLPEKSITGRLSRTLGKGWLAGISAGKRVYDKSDVELGSMGIEYYFSFYRLAYTLYSSKVEKGGTNYSHSIGFDYYYAKKSSAGIRLSTGKESENLDGTNIISTRVKSAALVSRYWLNDHWGITCSATYHQQGNYYDRYGLLLGIRYSY